MIHRDDLIEYAEYVNNYYGTPKKYVGDQLKAGKNVILEIEIQGALKVREKFPDTKLLFVTTPTADELKSRLLGRGTETADVIEARLSRAYEESLGMELYDYLVINDDLEQTVDLVHQLIQNECEDKESLNQEHRISSNIDFINKMRNELLSFSKGE